VCDAVLPEPSPLGGRPRMYCSNRCKQKAKWDQWRAIVGGLVSNNSMS